MYAIQLTRLLGGADGTMPQPLPRDLTAVLRARVAEIDSDPRDTLRVAAVIGEEFSVTVLAAVLGREELGVAHTLETARRAGLVTPTETFDQYAFVHGLVQQMAYEDLDASRRVRLHAAAARVLASGSPPRPIAAARHLLAARPVVDTEDLFVPLVVGARAATEVAALDTTARCTPWRWNASRASARTRRRS